MASPLRYLIPAVLVLLVSACTSANIDINTPSGQAVRATFYAGNQVAKVPDLLIIDGKNYFGVVGYQMQDPLGDISFRLEDGRKIQAECAKPGKNSIDKPECKSYLVYRSDFDPIPVNSTALRPAGIP